MRSAVPVGAGGARRYNAATIAANSSASGFPRPEEREVRSGVREVLGPPPRTFADWAARNVDAFR